MDRAGVARFGFGIAVLIPCDGLWIPLQYRTFDFDFGSVTRRPVILIIVMFLFKVVKKMT